MATAKSSSRITCGGILKKRPILSLSHNGFPPEKTEPLSKASPQAVEQAECSRKSRGLAYSQPKRGEPIIGAYLSVFRHCIRSLPERLTSSFGPGFPSFAELYPFLGLHF